MSKPKFVKLSNGVIFALEDVQVIARQGINEYHVIMRGCPHAPRAEAHDVQKIVELLGEEIAVFEETKDAPAIQVAN